MESANLFESSTSWQMKAKTCLGAFVNVLLTILKAVVGWAIGSTALIAVAGHSFSDLLSDGVTLWALMQGRMPKNDTPMGMVDLKPSGPFLLLFSWGLQH